MHVTIGGQKIAIKTKPSEAATPDTPSASPAVSPMMGGRKSPLPQDESEQESDEAREDENGGRDGEEVEEMEEAVGAQDDVVDLLAEFTSGPMSAQDPPSSAPSAAPVVMNSDILDLLGGMDTPQEPSSPTPVKLQGSIGNVAVVVG